ncbi:MAG TPA: aspartate--tRNA ligase, partial [Aggregatilineales bacterium]|nr:aspartate--tRNA ligase [Aggregatilineales bacterium]
MLKTHNCGELRPEHDGQEVTLAGWVDRWREHGGLNFLDLRDRWGITQVTFNRETSPEAHNAASAARSEWVLQITGTVRKRPEEAINPGLTTGEVELIASNVVVLNKSQNPPFYINNDDPVDEALRLRYRYLDLRRARMQKNILLRHNVIKFIRDYLIERGFVEIETPILFKTTPEGARDYLVPSRVHPGKFYALPQSPQQIKQLLMVAGYERYFQIARCFRDEDQRGDRQPEFTQLDMEMSFIERDDVLDLIEGLMTAIVEDVSDKKLLFKPFPRFKYRDVMEKYGSDKPDLRYGLEAIDISDIAGESTFAVFQKNVADGKPVKVMRVPELGAWSNTKIKSFHQELEDLTRTVGGKGLAYVAIPAEEAAEVRGPIAKFFNNAQQMSIFERTGAQPGDLLFFISDERKIVYEIVDTLRRELAKRLELTDPNVMAFAWVIDFPLFEWNEDETRWDPSHHLFTAPMPEDAHYLDTEPGKARGTQYDLVCNGYEIAGGSIRIHKPEMQEKVFELIGLDLAVAKERFGHMLEAFT